MAHDRIADMGVVIARRVWREGWLTVPGISVALLPKLACPLCWPFYSGVVSQLAPSELLRVLGDQVNKSRPFGSGIGRPNSRAVGLEKM